MNRIEESVLNDAKQIFASKYKLTLPTEEDLQIELNKARKRLELENMEIKKERKTFLLSNI